MTTTASKLCSPFVAERAIPQKFFAAAGIQGTLYLDSLLEPAVRIPQGDANTTYDLSAGLITGTSLFPGMDIVHDATPASDGAADVLFIGDSLTDDLAIRFEEQIAALLGYTVTTRGLLSSGPINHQAHPGQTAAWFATDVASPITDVGGSLDVPAYLVSIGTPDYVFVSLGTNDAVLQVAGSRAFGTTLRAVLGHFKAIVDAFLAADGTLRVLLCPPPSSNPNESAYASISATAARWRVSHRRLIDGLRAQFEDYDARVFLLPTYLVMDRDDTNKWPTTTPFAVHPGVEGYREIVRASMIAAISHFESLP